MRLDTELRRAVNMFVWRETTSSTDGQAMWFVSYIGCTLGNLAKLVLESRMLPDLSQVGDSGTSQSINPSTPLSMHSQRQKDGMVYQNVIQSGMIPDLTIGRTLEMPSNGIP